MRLEAQPVRVDLHDAGEDVHDLELQAEQPHRPRRRRRRQPRRRNHHQDEGDQHHQVEVVEIARLVEQEHVGEGEEERHRRQAVEHAKRDEEREHGERGEVPVHAVARPWLDPPEAVVLEEEMRRDVVALDPAFRPEAPALHQHDDPEHHAEYDQRRGVDLLEQRIDEPAPQADGGPPLAILCDECAYGQELLACASVAVGLQGAALARCAGRVYSLQAAASARLSAGGRRCSSLLLWKNYSPWVNSLMSARA